MIPTPSPFSRTVQIIAPHFCAGIVVARGVVIDAAPIIRWLVGRDLDWVIDQITSRNWSIGA